MSTDLAPLEQQAIGDALTASAIRAQVELIQQVMRESMIKDVHYGVIPGTNKPTLLKPGAQKLMLTFRFDPQFESTERFAGDHLFIKSKCVLYHITSGRRLGSGEGSCSTKESKYAYRKGQRLCPHCGKDAIIKGKEQYGGGWLCWKKKEGCGAQWPDGATEIESQSVDRVANEDLADVYNTVLKMANKRSLVDAVLNVTGASDVFTQDMEDGESETAPPREKLQDRQGDGASTQQANPGSSAQQASDAPAPVKRQTTPAKAPSLPPEARTPPPPSTEVAQAWSELIQVSESVAECSMTLNRMEADPAVDLFAKTQLRDEGKAKVLALRKGKA